MFIVIKAHLITLTFKAHFNHFLPEKKELIPPPFEV